MEALVKFLNCSLIDTLCEARHEEFETLYIKSKRKNKSKDILTDNVDAEQELLDEIRKHVSDDKARVEIIQKINKFESYLYGDFDAILRRIYRLGVVDGYKLKREIKDIINED